MLSVFSNRATIQLRFHRKWKTHTPGTFESKFGTGIIKTQLFDSVATSTIERDNVAAEAQNAHIDSFVLRQLQIVSKQT